MIGRWLLLAWVLVALPAGALKKGYQVQFHTYPSGVQVIRYHPENSDPTQDDFLGTTDKPISLSLDDDEKRDEWMLYFVPAGVERTRSSEADMLRVRMGDLVAGTSYPRQGVLRVNLTWGQWLVHWGRNVLLPLWWLWVILGYVGFHLFLQTRERWRQARDAEEREARRSELTIQTVAGDPLEGHIMGEYQILKRLGEGGMGVVYRAVPKDDPDLAKAVAIKLIRSLDKEFRDRFLREAQIYARLRHPNIMVVIETGLAEVKGVPDGWPYMVMECIQGPSLREIVRLNPEGLGLRHAAITMLQILQAVHYAHQQGVVHRDLKPENVMIAHTQMPDGQPRVVVMDFGLARHQDLNTVTAHGEVLGTPCYMSPEQMRGGWSPETDQYALGVLFYELLTGRLPFDGESTPQIIMQHLHDEPKPLRQLRPNLPDSLEKTVARMLAKAPEDRFPDLGQVIRIVQPLAEIKRTASQLPKT